MDTTYQLAFLARLANFRRSFPQYKLGFGIFNLLPTYGRVFGSFRPLHIFDPLMFLVKSANFWRWFSQTEFGSDLPNLLPTYGTFSGHSNYLLWTSSHVRHVRAYPSFPVSNAFLDTTSQVV
jgi:hypothetical protein